MTHEVLIEEPTQDVLFTEHGHPSDWGYVKIAIALAILTAIEVALSYIKGVSDALIVGFLLLAMVVKFVVVAGYFMHLKYDSPFLRRVFIAGIAFAVIFYSAYLFTLGILVG